MSNKEAVQKLLALLKGYQKIIAIIIFCLLLSTGLSLCIPLLSKRIMDDGFIGGNKELLIKMVLGSFVIHLANSTIDIIKEKKRVDISSKIQYSLSEESFSHLMRMKISYFSNKNYAEILNNINVDINNMTSIADEGVFFVVTQAFSMVGGVIGLFILDYRMTILVLLFIPIKYVVTKYFAKQRKKVMDEFIFINQKYSSWFGDTVGGVKEVKLFGIFANKHKEFVEKQNEVISKQKKMNMLSQWNNITDTVLVCMLTTLIYIIGSNLVFNLQLSVGSIFAFITYSTYVTGPISAILNIGYLLSGIIPSTKRYYEFMYLEEEDESKEAKVLLQTGDIEFQHVSFAYEKNKPVLKDINLRFPKGSKTALIGKNGSGKSTIVELLLRMYAPMKGQILLAGEDIFSTSLEVYRGIISVVSQEIYLFNDTIRNNICLYKQVDDSLILDVCRDSGLAEFVAEVTLDYVVGQNGTMLSGGQKQKIALARALLHERPIVVFDEATSSTDSYSEQQINSLLHTKLKDKTVIVITHRQEILNKVDFIVMLDEGQIVEQGSYEHIKKCGRYLDMVNVGS